jgi:hypothetical protein
MRFGAFVVLFALLAGRAAPVAAQETTAGQWPFASAGTERQVSVALGSAIAREARRVAVAEPVRSASNTVQQGSNRGRSKRFGVFVGLGIGALAGFAAGSRLEHSACEYDCPAGGITWGFTAAGAAGGAAVGWLIAR